MVWLSDANRADRTVPLRYVSWRTVGWAGSGRDQRPARKSATITASNAAAAPAARSVRREDFEVALAGCDCVAEVPDSPSRAKARSRAFWIRSVRFFSRQRRMIRSIAGDTCAPETLSSGGSSFRIAFIVSTDESRRNARWPESIS